MNKERICSITVFNFRVNGFHWLLVFELQPGW